MSSVRRLCLLTSWWQLLIFVVLLLSLLHKGLWLPFLCIMHPSPHKSRTFTGSSRSIAVTKRSKQSFCPNICLLLSFVWYLKSRLAIPYPWQTENHSVYTWVHEFNSTPPPPTLSFRMPHLSFSFLIMQHTSSSYKSWKITSFSVTFPP